MNIRGGYAIRLQAHVAWAPFVCAVLGILIVATFPVLLVPVAWVYQAICSEFPELALLTNHLPAMPLSLLLVLSVFALGNGLRIAGILLVGTIRFNHLLQRGATLPPMRLTDTAARLNISDRVTCIDSPRPAAFCYGFLRPGIVLTNGSLDCLDDEALMAVLAHERHHLHRRDPVRYLALQILAAVTFMLPVTRHIRQRFEVQIEIDADRAAIRVTSPGALATALLAVLKSEIIQPPGAISLTATDARIAHIAGDPVLPAIPTVTWILSICFALVVALAFTELYSSAHLVSMACDMCPVRI